MISVIIPTLNEAENIGQLIQFLKSITCSQQVAEIIVVDAQSTDATAEIAHKAGAKVIVSEKRGRAVQMNCGAKAARGCILYFLHADCLPPRTFVGDIYDAFTEGADVGCFRYRFDSKHPLLKINGFFTRFSPLWCRGGDESMFIRKETFEKLGGFDERFCVMEEYDFIRRAHKAGLRFEIVPRYAVVSARKYDKNGWLRVQLANWRAFKMFQKGVDSSLIAQRYKKALGLSRY